MKLKNLFITLGLSLAVGVGALVGVSKTPVKEVEAATSTSVYYAINTTYTVKLNVNFKGDGDDWHQYVMEKQSNQYNSKDVYGYTFTDAYDGLGRLQFQLYDGDSWESQVEPISEWTSVSVYNGKLYDGSEWKSDYTPAPVPPSYISLIGDFGGHSWNYDVDFEIDEGTHTATLSSYQLSKGNSFKLRKNHLWDKTYGWDEANGHISVTDSQGRGEDCLGDANDSNNIAVLHDGIYNFSLDYQTDVLTITGERALNDSDVAFEIYISNGGDYVPTTMPLKAESTTEFVLTRDFVAGEKFYLKYGSSYYHYSDFKENDGTLKGKQFVAAGNDVQALYNANYTIYFETESGSNFGLWMQYNSVSEAQIRANVISYATYFNDEVGGACKNDGTTVISELQTAWANVKTRYDNSPAASVRTAIAAATAEDENAEVSEFVGKYAKVYELRGSSLSTQGGDFLSKGITPQSADVVSLIVKNNNNTTLIIVVIASIAAVSAFGIFLAIKRRKEN